MRKIPLYLFLICLFSSAVASAQPPAVIQDYINAYKDIAIAEEQRSGVPASITIAQGIHETSAGTSELVKASNNHFGIKCKTGWTGPSVSHTDDAPNECFRKYDQPADSYRDHSDFLRNSPRYASLFQLDPMDYEAWAKGLKKAGYATNPRYPQIIIGLIEDYHLQDYTLIAMGKLPPDSGTVATVMLPEEKKQETLAPDQAPVLSGQDPAVDPDPNHTGDTKTNETNVEPEPWPTGEFRINDTRVIWLHEGVSLLSVAQQYDVPLARIFEYNELPETETLAKAQLIFLQRKKKTGAQEFHVVRAGETLADVAQQQGIRLESLMELNQLKNNMQPAPGEKLYLKKKTTVLPRLL